MAGSLERFRGNIHEVPPSRRLAIAKGLWKWEPHPTQREWFVDTSRVKVASCGRRWGKTESAIIDDLTLAIAIPGITIMVVAPTNDQVKLLYDPAKYLVESTEELNSCCKCKSNPHPEIIIESPEGNSRILFRSAGEDGKNIRGHFAHRIRIDEAAYIKDAVVSAVLEPMLMDFNGQLILQGTPFGKNWFYKMFQMGLPGSHEHEEGCASFTFPSTTNPFTYAKTYVEKMKKKYGERSIHFRAEYLAEFIDSLGSVFSYDDISKCLFYEEIYPVGLTDYLAGIDPALYRDYCSVIVGASDRGMLWIRDWDHFNRESWDDTKLRIYNKVTEYNAMGIIDATHGSSGDSIANDLKAGLFIPGPGGTFQKMPGLNLVEVEFTNKLKEQMVKKLQVRMNQGLLRIPAHFLDLITELKYFGYELLESGKVRYEAQGQEHDDLVMALALMMSYVHGNYKAAIPNVLNNPNCLANVYAQLDAKDKQDEEMIVGSRQTRGRK